MGSQQCRIVGESQPALIMIDPIIFTRNRMIRSSHQPARGRSSAGHRASSWVEIMGLDHNKD
jgi:hypothetical protein|eukprot:SAG25_NODE_650_length_6188_cov_4.455740_4_plen_62_part_00